MPRCTKCEREPVMDDMGYGDYRCPDCGHVDYAESEEDFNNRINPPPRKEK